MVYAVSAFCCIQCILYTVLCWCVKYAIVSVVMWYPCAVDRPVPNPNWQTFNPALTSGLMIHSTNFACAELSVIGLQFSGLLGSSAVTIILVWKPAGNKDDGKNNTCLDFAHVRCPGDRTAVYTRWQPRSIFSITFSTNSSPIKSWGTVCIEQFLVLGIWVQHHDCVCFALRVKHRQSLGHYCDCSVIKATRWPAHCGGEVRLCSRRSSYFCAPSATVTYSVLPGRRY